MKENPDFEQEFQELDYLEFFTTPFHLNNAEDEKLLKQLPENKYKHVVVVGRFQPLHYGHLYLMKQALRLADAVTIGVGSVNLKDDDNPFSFYQRKYMIHKALKRDGMMDKIQGIVPIYDYPDDNKWVNEALKKIGKVDAVIGNNDWVNRCFNDVGIDSLEVPLLQRGIYEGKKIRAFLRTMNKI